MKITFSIIFIFICILGARAESLDVQLTIPEAVSIDRREYRYRLESLRANWSDYLEKTREALLKGDTPTKEEVNAARRAAGIRAIAASVVAAGVFIKDANEAEDLFAKTIMLLKDERVPADIQFPGQMLANLTGVAFSSSEAGAFGATLAPTFEQVTEPPRLTFAEIVDRAKRMINAKKAESSR